MPLDWDIYDLVDSYDPPFITFSCFANGDQGSLLVHDFYCSISLDPSAPPQEGVLFILSFVLSSPVSEIAL